MTAHASCPAAAGCSRGSFWLRFACLLTWVIALTVLALLPAGAIARSGPLTWDKLNHFAAFAVLALLLLRTLAVRWAVSGPLLVCAWLACMAFGLMLELLQRQMALGRQGEIGDLLANAAGVLVACVIFRHGSGRYFGK